jgi:hypothetical protein
MNLKNIFTSGALSYLHLGTWTSPAIQIRAKGGFLILLLLIKVCASLYTYVDMVYLYRL